MLAGALSMRDGLDSGTKSGAEPRCGARGTPSPGKVLPSCSVLRPFPRRPVARKRATQEAWRHRGCLSGRRRVLQEGQDPSAVFAVGTPSQHALGFKKLADTASQRPAQQGNRSWTRRRHRRDPRTCRPSPAWVSDHPSGRTAVRQVAPASRCPAAQDQATNMGLTVRNRQDRARAGGGNGAVGSARSPGGPRLDLAPPGDPLRGTRQCVGGRLVRRPPLAAGSAPSRQRGVADVVRHVACPGSRALAPALRALTRPG